MAVAGQRADGVTEVLNSSDHDQRKDSFALIYGELRRLAAMKMNAEAVGHTLQPTALVHEAWLRLSGPSDPWQNRAHFFGAAAEAMRRILVDHARKKLASKRGSGVETTELEKVEFELIAPTEELLAIHDSLDRLALEDSEAAELVKLRYFVGMTMEEAASSLGMPIRSAERVWTYARAWLKRDIRH